MTIIKRTVKGPQQVHKRHNGGVTPVPKALGHGKLLVLSTTITSCQVLIKRQYGQRQVSNHYSQSSDDTACN